MTDSSHLEKMGRELKCPICLSLLNSAVSLTCNHVFCNLCISKSMRSASNCPVCKVPYCRREVRPAPHMDNLVTIYKSMEAASGVNIFVTQAAPSTKNSGPKDAQIQGEGNPSSCGAENDEAQQRKSRKRKAVKELCKTNVRISDSGPSAKPSFPAKKRVQVPLVPLSETPVRPKRVSKSGDQGAEHEVERTCGNTEANECDKDASFVLKEKPAFDEKGEPVFKPFFWLREAGDNEVTENLTPQQTDGGLNTPTYNAPTFSDIKDSDNESPIKMTPAGEVASKSIAADVFDSEMFEWTQRPCSPELYSTPMKKQTTDKHTLDGIHHREDELGNVNMEGELPMVTSQKNSNRKADGSRNKTIKKSRRKSRKVKRKDEETSTDRTDTVPGAILGEIPTNCGEIPGNPIQKNENKCSKNTKTPSLGRDAGKSNRKGRSCPKKKHAKALTIQVNKTATIEVLDEAYIESCQGSRQEKGNADVDIVFPGLSSFQTENNEAPVVGNTPDRSHKNTTNKSEGKHMKRSKDQIVKVGATKALAEVPINRLKWTQNQNQDKKETELLVSLCRETENDKSLGLEKKTSKRIRKFYAKVESSNVRQPEELKRLKSCTSEITKGVQLNSNRNDEKENHFVTEHQDVEITGGNNTSTTKALSIAEARALKKCKNLSSQIFCAFCQSCDESEASGKMLHYFNGKMVEADYNEGSNVIHSHRNCTEWAPNVYFEDDTAINLEAELSRSRRIKCCCCGIKGATLGCYEKSCRKSFHIPCAKLTHECRWDTENFVMLCPLHSSLKLPNEVSGTEKREKRKSQPRERMNPGLKMNALWKWPSGSPSKWVICCSALTVAEKEIVSKFARLAGVSMSKTWSPVVTHVIASTNDNGACRRTIKFFMGILEGKWILTMDWIKACMTEKEPVSEEQYEIGADVHGVKDGPQHGRQRIMNKEPKLFNALKFYFTGDFVPSYKGYLQDLVVAAGGFVLQRKPISRDQATLLNESPALTTFIIYSLELPEKCDSSKQAMVLNCRRTEAQKLADAIGAKAATHSWILDSIAACKLQNLD